MASRQCDPECAVVPHRLRSLLAWTVCASLAGCASEAYSTAQATVGLGNLAVDVEGVGSDSTGCRLMEFAFEAMPQANMGFGARARGLVSDDDLDRSPGNALPGSSQATDSEWFLHATFDRGTTGTRFPFRLGMFLRNLGLEDSATGASLDYSSYGPRIEFSPIVPFVEDDGFSMSLTGLVGFGYGIAKVEDSVLGGDPDTNAGFMELGLGIRTVFSKAWMDLGYRYQSSTYEKSDGAAGSSVAELDAVFSGAVLSLGFKF